jgi:hypothetical protein
MAKKYATTTGWTSMRRPQWQYKDASEHDGGGLYMRMISASYKGNLDEFKHHVVFCYFGEPPPQLWEEWESVARGTGQARNEEGVVLKDYRLTERGRKRRRKMYCNNLECSTEISHDQAKKYDNFCQECYEDHQKAKKREAQRLESASVKRKNELGMINGQLDELSLENTSLKEQNDTLNLELENLHRILKSREANSKKTVQTLKQNLSVHSKSIELLEKCQVKDQAALHNTIDIFSQMADNLARFGFGNRELYILKNEVATLNRKHYILQNRIAEAKSLLEPLRMGTDLRSGSFAKALMSDLYKYGIFYCGSKHRGYHTISERRGNVMKYNQTLKPLIEEIIGMHIPIVKELEYGLEMSLEELAPRLQMYGFNLDFARRDIMYKKTMPIRKFPDKLFKLYCDSPSTLLGAYMDKEAFLHYVKDEKEYENLFLSVYMAHRRQGLQQRRPNFYDYSNYEFYELEKIRISFVQEGDRIHLQTYTTTRQYIYCQPKLIKNLH